MTEYRSPEQHRASLEQDARIQAAFKQAITDGGSLMAAIQLGEPADVVEMWIDRLYDGLRANLSDDRPPVADLLQEDRLAAIVLLLTDRIAAESRSILRQIKQVAE